MSYPLKVLHKSQPRLPQGSLSVAAESTWTFDVLAALPERPFQCVRWKE